MCSAAKSPKPAFAGHGKQRERRPSDLKLTKFLQRLVRFARPRTKRATCEADRVNRTFAGAPDMFLPRVPPHTPVTVGRQKHIGPANESLTRLPPTPLDINRKKLWSWHKGRETAPSLDGQTPPRHSSLRLSASPVTRKPAFAGHAPSALHESGRTFGIIEVYQENAWGLSPQALACRAGTRRNWRSSRMHLPQKPIS